MTEAMESWRRTAQRLKGELLHANYAIEAWRSEYYKTNKELELEKQKYKKLCIIYNKTRLNLEKEREKKWTIYSNKHHKWQE